MNEPNHAPHRDRVHLGLTLSSEEHPPRRLVELASLAEDTGFDFVSISDHFHPWIDAQGHSPFVWAVLGAIGERTSELEVGVGVTCPIIRVHPVVLAQASATVAHLLDGRFTWGVGTGEALNEHVTAEPWPPAPHRLAMLEEAIGIVRELWAGEEVTYDGAWFSVENARIYDPPPSRVPIVMSAFGPKATELAARVADGLWVTGSSGDGIERWRDEGGTGPVWSQLTVCWGAERDAAVELAHRVWPTSAIPGQLSQDLPTPAHFEQAAQLVTPELIAEQIPCGPDVEAIVERARAAVDAGVDHLYFPPVGPNQEGFCKVWRDEIAPALQPAA